MTRSRTPTRDFFDRLFPVRSAALWILILLTVAIFWLVAKAAGATDISAGVTDYDPGLRAVDAQYATEHEPSGWYARLRAEQPDPAKTPYTVVLTYAGCRTRGQDLDMDIHALDVSYVLELGKVIVPYVGGGPGMVYLKRSFASGQTFHEFPWSVHGMVGLRVRSALGMDVGYQWTWSKSATAGGLEYDLGCQRWYAGVTLGD